MTKSDEAGVRQESVSSVPPTTPMDRVRAFGGVTGGAMGECGGRSVSVMRGPIGWC
ncbi:hypothetical protein [Streptomyces sp. SPB162]|uniref:hypothetical protein n=1 Tax=Streptomyces sp. SPB162 TaxID=2940560 RepID=UPI0024067656|nr:hypothetical protein [Streptomyces sp. SPB162]MDF9813191.1 hypothetical protein [Streptomyces sp. SPB162]